MVPRATGTAFARATEEARFLGLEIGAVDRFGAFGFEAGFRVSTRERVGSF
jgi:hypothetical protein